MFLHWISNNSTKKSAVIEFWIYFIAIAIEFLYPFKELFQISHGKIYCVKYSKVLWAYGSFVFIMRRKIQYNFSNQSHRCYSKWRINNKQLISLKEQTHYFYLEKTIKDKFHRFVPFFHIVLHIPFLFIQLLHDIMFISH